MFCVPLYFQGTTNASAKAAGAYLMPGFIGNLAGALAAGSVIKRWVKDRELQNKN